jgi:hypothetical protein
VPLHIDNLKREDLQPVLDKLIKRIVGWRGRLLAYTLREKYTAERRPHEEWRHTDHASPSSRLTLQTHLRRVPGRVSHYGTHPRRASNVCVTNLIASLGTPMALIRDVPGVARLSLVRNLRRVLS